MPDLLQTGAAALGALRKAHMASAVVYRRGAEDVEIQATVGRTLFELSDSGGVVERIESRDFLVEAADLVLDSIQVLPQAGDRIRETSGTTVYVYEVQAPGQEPCWRWSDAWHRTLRIHTKHVDTETS